MRPLTARDFAAQSAKNAERELKVMNKIVVRDARQDEAGFIVQMIRQMVAHSSEKGLALASVGSGARKLMRR